MPKVSTVASFALPATGAALVVIVQTPPDIAKSNAAKWVKEITGYLPDLPPWADTLATIIGILLLLTPVWLGLWRKGWFHRHVFWRFHLGPRPAAASLAAETRPNESVPAPQEDLSPSGRPWIRLSPEEADACKGMLLRLDGLLTGDVQNVYRSICWTGDAPQKLPAEVHSALRCRDEARRIADVIEEFREANRYPLELLALDLGSVIATARNTAQGLTELEDVARHLGSDLPESMGPLIKRSAEPAARANGEFGNAISNLRNEIRQTRGSIVPPAYKAASGGGGARLTGGEVEAGGGGDGQFWGAGGGGGGGLRIGPHGDVDAGGGGGGGGISPGGQGGGSLGGGGGGATGFPPGYFETESGEALSLIWELTERYKAEAGTDDLPPDDWANAFLEQRGAKFIYSVKDGAMTLSPK